MSHIQNPFAVRQLRRLSLALGSVLIIAACSQQTNQTVESEQTPKSTTAIAEAQETPPVPSEQLDRAASSTTVAVALNAPARTIEQPPAISTPAEEAPSPTTPPPFPAPPDTSPTPDPIPDPDPAPAPGPTPTTQPESLANEEDLTLVKVDDYPITKIKPEIGIAPPTDIVNVNPCGSFDTPHVSYTRTTKMNIAGDGAVDRVSVLNDSDGKWWLRLDVADGWTSQVELVGPITLGFFVATGSLTIGNGPGGVHIVVEESVWGSPEKYNHFFGTDDNGCLQPQTTQLLQGVTDTAWYSLECDTNGTNAAYVTVQRSDSVGQFDVYFLKLRTDGSFEPMLTFVLASDHAWVKHRGHNNCIG